MIHTAVELKVLVEVHSLSRAETHISLVAINSHPHVLLPLTPTRGGLSRLSKAIHYMRGTQQRQLRMALYSCDFNVVLHLLLFSVRYKTSVLCWRTSIDRRRQITLLHLSIRGLISSFNRTFLHKKISKCRSFDQLHSDLVHLEANGSHIALVTFDERTRANYAEQITEHTTLALLELNNNDDWHTVMGQIFC